MHLAVWDVRKCSTRACRKAYLHAVGAYPRRRLKGRGSGAGVVRRRRTGASEAAAWALQVEPQLVHSRL